MAANNDDNLPPAPPGMKWTQDGPLGILKLVPEGQATSEDGAADPAAPEEPAGLGGMDFGTTEVTLEPPGEATETTEAEESSSDASMAGGDAAAELDRAVTALQNARDAYEAAYEAENCGFCLSLMDALRSAEFETQIKGLRELHELETMDEDAMDEGDINAVLDRFEVIPKFAQAAAQQNTEG